MICRMKAQTKQQMYPLIGGVTKDRWDSWGLCSLWKVHLNSSVFVLPWRAEVAFPKSTTAAQNCRRPALFIVSPHTAHYERVSDSVPIVWFLNFALPAETQLCGPQTGKSGELGAPTHIWNWANSQQECWHRPTLPPIFVWKGFKIDIRSSPGRAQWAGIMYMARQPCRGRQFGSLRGK
jgi:hypothetical protein